MADVASHHPHRHSRAPCLLLLLWLLLISLILLTPFTNPPSPFRAPPKHGIDQGHRIDDGDGVACDLFDGKWVRDEGGSGYTNGTCRTLPDSKNCRKYGKDQEFLNWRWKPEGCELPRFDAAAFLRVVRGKRLAFVGDSVARNQMESLLCLLSQVEAPVDVVQKDAGAGADVEDRFRTWRFPSHDFTVMTLWTRFLVVGKERVINGSASGVYDLHLDKIDPSWADKIRRVDYAVVSDGHWFFRKVYLYERGELIGCVFCSEAKVRDLGLSFAVGRAFRTALRFVDRCEGCGGVVTLVRTFSPSHFENGSWDGGGGCGRTRPLEEGEVRFGGSDWEVRGAQVEEVERVRGEGRGGPRSFGVLDVTKAMMMRADAHPGLHWNNQWMRGYSDCVHWCMPGPIDVWNDLLLAVLIKKGSIA